MNLYSDHPARRARQVIGDALVLAWVVLWVLVGIAVHRAVSALAAPGRTLESAGLSLEGGLGDAAEAIGAVPLLGEDLRTPFDSAGGAASSITDAGQQIQEAVAAAAVVAGLGVAAWPVLGVLGVWTWLRLRFARRAAAARALLASGTDLDLFALRALARMPLTTLSRVSPDPAGDWRRGDPQVVRRLAELELRSVGLSAPAPAPA